MKTRKGDYTLLKTKMKTHKKMLQNSTRRRAMMLQAKLLARRPAGFSLQQGSLRDNF